MKGEVVWENDDGEKYMGVVGRQGVPIRDEEPIISRCRCWLMFRLEDDRVDRPSKDIVEVDDPRGKAVSSGNKDESKRSQPTYLTH